ncbi:hypothetical protein ACMFY5_10520, partial [Pseudomonas sihuiensis]
SRKKSEHSIDWPADHLKMGFVERLQITDAVGQINDMAAQIASAAEEQACVTVEVNRNTENIRAMGDQMSQSSHAASAAASNLQALGRQIGSEVSKFVL